MEKNPDGGRDRSTIVDLGRYAGLGLQFAGSLALFGALGWWIDRLLHTKPWIMILGMLGGSALAFVSLLRAVPTTQGGKKRSGSPPPGNA